LAGSSWQAGISWQQRGMELLDRGALLAAGRRGAPGCFLSGSVNFGRLVAARPRVCYEGHYGTRWLGSTAAVKYIPKI